MPLPQIKTPRRAQALGLLLALTFSVATGCGDNDSDDAQNLESPNEGGAPGDSDPENNVGDDPIDEQEDDPDDNDDGPLNNDDMADCAPDALRITAPAQGSSLTPSSDEDPQARGVQVSVTLTANVAEGTLVTLENQTTQESVGARSGSGALVFEGVNLVEGVNALQASALVEGCLASSPLLEVTLNSGDDPDDNNTPDPDPDPGEAFRFVLVEDTTPTVSGRSPGADLDAISVLRGGDEFFAVTVEDSRVDHPDNEFNDVTALLGPSDADCEVQNFTSLGGQRFGGYVIVSFEGSGDDDTLTLRDGDSIKVYEIGAFLCGRFDDDPYRVAVSVSTELGTFIEVGSGGAGGNVIPVSGLP